MRIEISESHYKAMCEVAKSIPTELAAKGTKSKNGNERIVVECRQGPLMAGDGRCGGNYITAIVQAANLMREISYNAQINRLQEERDGYAD
jgi:hypothetical protein